MFARWGRFVYRRRRWVALLSVLVAAISFGFAAQTSSVLTTGGWYDPSSESQQVAQRLSTDFGHGGSSVVVLFVAPSRTDATSPAFQAQVASALTSLQADSRVSSIVGYAQTGSPSFISTSGDATFVLVNLNLTEDQAMTAVDGIRSEIGKPDGITVQLTGAAALSAATTAQSAKDLARAESISLPIALLILILVFGSLIAAGLPLFVAGLTIPTTLALIWAIAQHVTMSVFVTSIVTMLGLALAIDYSLFMVSRFREELACGATVEEAIQRTVATSGKAVAFSGTAVAIGLSGLLLFRAPTLSSMGIGGALIALTSVAFALTFLPAMLGMLGPRVERLRLPNPFRRFSNRQTAAAGAAGAGAAGAADMAADVTAAAPTHRTGLWERIALAVMARPLVVLVPALALLLALGIPFLGERQGLPGADVLPASAEARAAWDTIETKFPTGETRPVDLLVTVQGDPLSAPNAAALADYSARVASLSGVARVDGPYSFTSPTGQALPSSVIAATVSAPPSSRPAALNAAIASMVHGSTVHLQAISPLVGTSGAQTLIQSIRGLSASAGTGMTVAVGGEDAASVDFLNAQNSELPIAIVFILIAMALMLMLQFGSVVIPIKAVVMTLLSLTASFGALVWIFQDGNLSGILGFQSPGFTVAIVPILMFSIIFGLSMDYEVLLLSRIQEAYRKTGDTSQAVVEGLAKTGRVITGAAVIMVAVFAAFGLADMIVIKSLGIGMAIAVLLDATVVRGLLVPATMRLLGHRAWWAPSRLSRFSSRLGFSHVQTEYECDKPEPEPKVKLKPGARLGRPNSEPAAG
jgi:uncharacterized membrane protein YdfJ with MMPL/SSD domain